MCAMSHVTAAQRRRQDRFESLIRLMEPGLNLVLAVGDRVSRIVDRDDPGPLLVRPLDAQALHGGTPGDRG
jgi:hypothetical protein